MGMELSESREQQKGGSKEGCLPPRENSRRLGVQEQSGKEAEGVKRRRGRWAAETEVVKEERKGQTSTLTNPIGFSYKGHRRRFDLSPVEEWEIGIIEGRLLDKVLSLLLLLMKNIKILKYILLKIFIFLINYLYHDTFSKKTYFQKNKKQIRNILKKNIYLFKKTY